MPIADSYISADTNPQTPSSNDLKKDRPRKPFSAPSSQTPYARSGTSHGQLAEQASGYNKYEGRVSPEETREELIERVKRDQRAVWLSPDDDQSEPIEVDVEVEEATDRITPLPARQRSSLLPPPDMQEDNGSYNSKLALEPPTSIERPRSALHSGDFRPVPDENAFAQRPTSPRVPNDEAENGWLGTSPPAPWLTRKQSPFDSRSFVPSAARPIPLEARTRSVSHSLSSFVFQPPTSPLANASHIADLDVEEEDLNGRSRRLTSPDRTSRRRTFSPGALRGLQTPTNRKVFPSAISRRVISAPYQAHQPRRSIPSLSKSYSLESSPVSPARSRKPSLVSDTSPLQRAPMIGRYEESILRGRMSSLPSTPLDFVAQIGVLGRGTCRASLRCPPHVTVPFPAVFFHSDDGRKSLGEAPSPYVGMILMEHAQPTKSEIPVETDQGTAMDIDEDDEQAARRRRRTRKREEVAAKVPKGGYRIPQQGQLQIVLRNPNRTAVKLFLVPYDLSGMEPGQKTFVRQRSFSAGPILDGALADVGMDRPVLRYVIHLQICCPSKGRFYLYKSIRVVFANRVPDGKEKLRQEIQLPEPRFSAYRPEKETPSVPPQLQALSLRPAGYFSLQDRTRSLVEQALDTPIGTPNERRNFAWETYAQQDDFTFPAKSLASGASGDLVKPSIDETSSLSDQLSPASDERPLSRSSALRMRGSFSPDSPSRPIFERLHRDDWATNGATQRPRSPGIGPGESLIARQHRSMSVRSKSSDERQ